VTDAASERYAQVAVLAHLSRAGGLYTYRVPPALDDTIGPGSLVHVPFGARRLQGVVWSLDTVTDLPTARD